MLGWRCSSVGRACVTPLRQVRFPGASRDFSPRVNFHEDSLSVSVHPRVQSHALTFCSHVKDSVVLVRVRWIIEKVKHPACTVTWLARICRNWLFSGKQPEFRMGEIPMEQYSCEKKSLFQNILKKKLVLYVVS